MSGERDKSREELLGELRAARMRIAELERGAQSRTIAFDGLLDSLADPIFIKDAQHRWVYFNQAFADLLGMRPAELFDHSDVDLFPEHEAAVFHEADNYVLSTGKSLATEEDLTIKGVTHRMRTVKSFWRDPISGAPLVLGVIHDITAYVDSLRALEESESRLRESEEKHHALASATFEAIFISENGICVETNEAASEMFGYSYEEIIGIFGTEVISEDTRHIVLRNMLSGYEEPYEAVGVRKDGTHFPAQFQGRMFRYKGRPARVTAVRDLTEQKRAERELAESEHKYRLLAENVEDVIFRTDAEFRFNYVSPSVRALLGMEPDEVLAQSLDQTLTPESQGRVAEARERRRLAEAAGDHNLVNRIELEMCRKDGSTVWVEVISKGLRDAQGRNLGLVGLARNIAERKQMERQLVAAKEAAEAANKAKSEFLANVSHEIRTPLNGMLGMLQLLQGGELDPDSAEMIGTALDCGRGLVALINDILDLSQIEAGVVRLHPREFMLDKTIDSVLAVFEHQAASRGLSLTCELDPATPLALHGDEGRLRQVLFNLVGNALKFTETGEVCVTACPLPHARPDGKVRLLFSVRDTGIGIPENRIGDVFETFTQVDGSYTRRYSGAGLGLSIVRRLVKLMGGGLVMDSEEGGGTEIFFSLPFGVAGAAVRPEARAFPSRPGVAAAPVPPERMRLLLAEDDRVGRIAVQGMLERLGHECIAVDCGRSAVEELLRGGYHCALLDIQMPDMSGLEAVRLAREALPENASLPPVVALTAHAMHGDRESFLAQGMDHYLSKPVNMDELRRLLDGLRGVPSES
ncbi:PAS domain-containing hybrid sensor histidine kinase/response regulator [Paucidesulfovibrio longus]|uniref:PAS domain-containing hybrid sensor histidine kinase/response regulator n=1 Tax=Paucidesulfovibrio longus TaxID=889 RepID=UPI0003B46248|nr:PAS domain S-box protein [Paucidesulfovibrio longus]